MPDAPVLLAGRYRLGESLGRGGMGQVLLARDETLERDVAIKELDQPLGGDGAASARRTLREARAAARISHPNVVQVYDVLQLDDRTWIVMEYVPSRSLREEIAEQGRLDPYRVARIGLDLLAALRTAHRLGVEHRDVKPANVLLSDDGRVLLTDFGIAAVDDDGVISRSDILVGSPQFMAPERAQNGVSGREADLWSLGATLYTAIEGHAPYQRGSTMATLAALATEEPDPPKHAGPLRPLLDGLLRKDPATRLNVEDAERLLRAVLADLPSSTEPSRIGRGVARALRPSSGRVPRPRSASDPLPAGSPGAGAAGSASGKPAAETPASTSGKPAAAGNATPTDTRNGGDRESARGGEAARPVSEGIADGDRERTPAAEIDRPAPGADAGDQGLAAQAASAGDQAEPADGSGERATTAESAAAESDDDPALAGGAASAGGRAATATSRETGSTDAGGGRAPEAAMNRSAAPDDDPGAGDARSGSGAALDDVPRSGEEGADAAQPRPAAADESSPAAAGDAADGRQDSRARATAGPGVAAGDVAAGGRTPERDAPQEPRTAAEDNATTSDGTVDATKAGGGPAASDGTVDATRADGGPVAFRGAARPAKPSADQGTRRRPLTLVAAAIAVLLLAGAAWLITGRDDGAPEAGGKGTQVTATAGTPTATPSQPPASVAPTQNAQAPAPSPSVSATDGLPALPAGWVKYTDKTGFSLYVPKDWKRTREGTMVYWRGDGKVLGIDQTNKPKSNPVADWREQSRNRVAGGDFPNYREVKIKAVDYFRKAADWEFTFDRNGARQHVNNRGTVVRDDKAYGFYWQTRDDVWDESRKDLQLVFDSFQPAK